MISFPPFRLDPVNRRLFRDQEEIGLRPKSLALLEYLLQRPGVLVTKQQLLDALWPDTSVTDAVLKVSVREIRAALGDDPGRPRFIETAQRYGYRFVGEVQGTNRPMHLTRFIGRDAEKRTIGELLDKARLVTVTGAGGSGKTRLVAEAIAGPNRVATDVFWVDLVALAEPSMVPQAVARAVGVRETHGRPLLQAICAQLAGRPLLVLDNCEHVGAACATVAAQLLQHCSSLKILATSREPLGIGGEVTWSLAGMSSPEPRDAPHPDELVAYEAVQLFVDRASAALPGFAVTVHNARSVAAICRTLDGMPLAIELAAARVKAITPDQIAERLTDTFTLLTGGSAAIPRHQTLRATFDWSHHLLSDVERLVLARLSVFAGPFTLEAAERIAGADGTDRGDILDALTRLIDKSWVVTSYAPDSDGCRYRLLETVRQYAQEKVAADELNALRSRHAAFYLAVAERAAPAINTARRIQSLGRLERDHPNLRAALRFAIDADDAATALRLAGALVWFWFHRNHWSEGRAWLAAALRLEQARNLPLRAAPLFGEGLIAWTMGDHEVGRTRLEESAALWSELGDDRNRGLALHFLSMELLSQHEVALARTLARESVSIHRATDDPWALALACASLGVIEMIRGDYVSAEPLLHESADLCRMIGDPWARALPLRNLGIMALRRGDCDSAVAWLKESLAVLQDLDEKWFVSRSVESLAEALAAKQDYDSAARLFGAAEALRESIGASVVSFYRDDYERGVGAVRRALRQDDLDSLWRQGRAMTPREIVTYALGC